MASAKGLQLARSFGRSQAAETLARETGRELQLGTLQRGFPRAEGVAPRFFCLLGRHPQTLPSLRKQCILDQRSVPIQAHGPPRRTPHLPSPQPLVACRLEMPSRKPLGLPVKTEDPGPAGPWSYRPPVSDTGRHRPLKQPKPEGEASKTNPYQTKPLPGLIHVFVCRRERATSQQVLALPGMAKEGQTLLHTGRVTTTKGAVRGPTQPAAVRSFP